MNDPNVATTNNIDTMKNRNVRLALLFVLYPVNPFSKSPFDKKLSVLVFCE